MLLSLLNEMQLLEELPEKNLEQGIDIRWNSLFLMFRCFRDNKKAIKACYEQHDFGENELTRLEWNMLEECVVSLEGFYSATLLIQRSDATISLIIPTIRAITLDLKEKQNKQIGNYFFIDSLLGALTTRFSSLLTKWAQDQIILIPKLMMILSMILKRLKFRLLSLTLIMIKFF